MMTVDSNKKLVRNVWKDDQTRKRCKSHYVQLMTCPNTCVYPKRHRGVGGWTTFLECWSARSGHWCWNGKSTHYIYIYMCVYIYCILYLLHYIYIYILYNIYILLYIYIYILLYIYYIYIIIIIYIYIYITYYIYIIIYIWAWYGTGRPSRLAVNNVRLKTVRWPFSAKSIVPMAWTSQPSSPLWRENEPCFGHGTGD